MPQLDLEAIEARLCAKEMPAAHSAEWWQREMQMREDVRLLVAEVRMLRQLCGTLMQEGAGRLD